MNGFRCQNIEWAGTVYVQKARYLQALSFCSLFLCVGFSVSPEWERSICLLEIYYCSLRRHSRDGDAYLWVLSTYRYIITEDVEMGEHFKEDRRAIFSSEKIWLYGCKICFMVCVCVCVCVWVCLIRERFNKPFTGVISSHWSFIVETNSKNNHCPTLIKGKL